MLYKSEELNSLYKNYLKNKKHKGKPYTQSWFSILLLKSNKEEEVWERERLPINKKNKIKVDKKYYLLFKKSLEEWYRRHECEKITGITKYIFNRIERYGEWWRIT